MAWLVENGQRIEGGLSPVFERDDLRVGMAVQIVREQGRKLSRAVIERIHGCWSDYRPVSYQDPNSRRWGQSKGYYKHGSYSKEYVPTHYMWTLTDDGEPLHKDCRQTHSKTCVHVRYGNGVRAVIDCLAYVRPLDSAIEQLARVLEEDEG
jgi:hypothetical protein